jgi:hypothetical protein
MGERQCKYIAGSLQIAFCILFRYRNGCSTVGELHGYCLRIVWKYAGDGNAAISSLSIPVESVYHTQAMRLPVSYNTGTMMLPSKEKDRHY